MIILNILLSILGLILFFLPGVLLSYIIFPKKDIIERSVFSIIFSATIIIISGIILYIFNLFNQRNIILILITLNLFFLLLFLFIKSKNKSENKNSKTFYNKDIFYLLFFSLIGSFWRIWFLSFIKNRGDAYTYAGKFTINNIPDLGFYTGMVVDHSKYIGAEVSGYIYSLLINNQYLGIFLLNLIFLGLIYLIFLEYRNRKLAYLAIALMSLGPIEIFHSSIDFLSHPLSYISLLCLFLFFKTKDNKIFLICLSLTIAMVFTYYTASMIILLASSGFILALLIKNTFKSKSLNDFLKNFYKNKKILGFLLIFLITGIFLLLFSKMLLFSVNTSKDSSNYKESMLTITEPFIENLTEISTGPISNAYKFVSLRYKDPAFLGLSAIRWQMLFFFLCGLTFILYTLIKKDFSEKNIDLLLCLIPITIVSYGFFYANLPTRIFNYFAFFGILVLKIPKKYFKVFYLLSFIFIIITGYYVMQDKKIFFENPKGEIHGAIDINKSFNNKIFSDQTFVNQLILNGYYNVTGCEDKNPLVFDLFYQKNESIFLNRVDFLHNSSIEYIAITKRMREKYILMLNYPQKPVNNIVLYNNNLIKVFDNGDVKVYNTDINNSLTRYKNAG